MSSLVRRLQKKRDGKAKREQERHDQAVDAMIARSKIPDRGFLKYYDVVVGGEDG